MTRNWTNRNSYGCEHVRPRDDWGESVEQWLSSMLAIGRTPETLRTRWYQIARFSRIVDRPIDQVDADAVIAFFLQSSMDLEVKRNARACVKVFYQWAVAHRIADHNPIDEVPVIPTRPRGWLICPEHAINEGLKSQDEDAVLAVMFGAWMGLRRLEMAQINIATDIEDNPEEMRLLVHGKGIKERVLPMPANSPERYAGAAATGSSPDASTATPARITSAPASRRPHRSPATACGVGSPPSPTTAPAATYCWCPNCSAIPASARPCATSGSTPTSCATPWKPRQGPTCRNADRGRP